MAISDGVPSSFNKICNAKCSTSLKSTIFLSFFLFSNIFPNSIIIFPSFFRTSYISFMSSFASFELNIKIFSVTFFRFAFTISLVAFASSFASNVIFLSVAQVLNFMFDAISYALFHESKFIFSICNCSMSSFIIRKYFCNSGYLTKFCLSASSFNSESSTISLTCFNNSSPQIVFEKSSSSFSDKLNISIFSFNHFSGNGLL